MIRKAVNEPRASSPITPAPPNMPAPLPACWPFCATSAFARSSSCLTSVAVSCESCFRSSPIGRSRRSPPLWLVSFAAIALVGVEADGRRRAGRGAGGDTRDRRGGRGRAADVAVAACAAAVARAVPGRARRELWGCRVALCAALLVALAARRLQEARCHEPERDPAGHHGP